MKRILISEDRILPAFASRSGEIIPNYSFSALCGLICHFVSQPHGEAHCNISIVSVFHLSLIKMVAAS